MFLKECNIPRLHLYDQICDIMFVIFYLTYVNNNKKLNIYTTVEKFGIGKTFLNNFLSHLCSPMLHLFDQKYNKKS